MKILVVCQYYYPENFQITPICEALVVEGYDVTVLTGLPNYPNGLVPEEYRMGHRKEIINGVKVIRCYEKGRQKGMIGLALNYGSFVFSAMRKINHFHTDYDLVFCYQLSPVTMAIPAMKFAKKNDIPFLIYCCDLWPESMKMYVSSERNPAFKIVSSISKKIYCSAERIIVQSKSFEDYLVRMHEIKKEKIVYIPAFADEAYLTQDFTPEDEVVDFVFLGNLGIAQDLFSVLGAINEIKYVSNYKVHFVGDGVCLDDMKDYVKKNGLGRIVEFHGRRPVEEMPKFYKLADACIVSLKAGNATGLTLPSKVQGYMAAGKPIFAMIEGSAQEVINDAGCGVCVDASDRKALAAAMKDFIEHKDKYQNCGDKGRKYFMEHFTKAEFVKRIKVELETFAVK